MPVLNHGLPCPFSLAPMASVLDIGAGIRPQTMFSTPRHVCVEPHFEYADALRESGYEVIETTWRDALKEIPDDSFDMVMALDVIEHLTKEEGWELKREMERVSSRYVLFVTPHGFMHQHCEGTDHWGLHGCVWQEHRSGWLPDDFDGYQIEYIMGAVTEEKEAFYALLVKP